MKEIPLTQGQVALVDDEDLEFISQWKWCARWCKYTKSFYAVRSVRHPQKTILMSRIVARTPDGSQCDHINHDTLDNRKANLRNCTKQENMRNRKGPQKNSTTGVLGVHKNWKGFRAHYSDKDGKHIVLPTRKTLAEAKTDREQAIKEHYGEFANMEA